MSLYEDAYAGAATIHGRLNATARIPNILTLLMSRDSFPAPDKANHVYRNAGDSVLASEAI